MKKLSLFFMAVLMTVCVANAQSRLITKSDLPVKAVETINSYFMSYNIESVVVEYEYRKRVDDYTVVFEDKSTIEFDKNGNWKNVDMHGRKEVPQGLVPEKIREYVKLYNKKQKINQISIDNRGRRSEEIEIELTSGLELKFDRKHQIKEVDL